MSDYQLLIIGAGPGGYMAALRAAKLGLHTAVVECREAGGTCLNRGCIPTKTLLHSSQIYRDAVNGAHAGVHAEGVTANVQEMFAYKRQISEKLSGGVESLLKSAKVDFIRGRATICNPGEVIVTDAEGAQTVYSADKIMLATGSAPAKPPIPGLDLPGVMTSDDLLDGDGKLYKSIVIIGGGVIGVEFATFYAELGCDVTIIEGMDRLLPTLDRELGQNLALILKKQGVKIQTGAMVQNVQRTADGLTVNYVVKEVPGQATAEAVLCAIGRRPYLDGLFPGELQPQMNGRRVQVDETYQTSIPGIYAIGDVSALIQLAHMATAQGQHCVDMLCDRPNEMDLSIVPSCIYCRPEIAVVGITEAEAKAAGIPVKVGKCIMFSNARTLIADPGRCFMKVVAHAETHEILGTQLMCQNSTDMISQIAQAMANKMTPQQLLRAMRPHPTFEEALTDALEDLVAKLNK